MSCNKHVFGVFDATAADRIGKGKCDVDGINPNLCTHLIYAHVELNKAGSIVRLPTYDGKHAMRRFNDLRDQGNRRLKTLVSIGDPNMATCQPVFSRVAADVLLRETCARNVRQFCETHGFDGVDINWIGPASTDTNNFVLLLAALATELHATGRLLTVSVSASDSYTYDAYDIAGIAAHVDCILLMAFDYYGWWDSYTGHNAPLYRAERDRTDLQAKLNVAHSVSVWLERGAPRDKLILGLAAYGRTFTLANVDVCGPREAAKAKGRAGPYTRDAGTLAYFEVTEALGANAGARTTWDEEQCVPYAVCDGQWISYDDASSVREKCKYIVRESLGGAMLWTIDRDEFQNDRFTLLRTVHECFQSTSPEHKWIVIEYFDHFLTEPVFGFYGSWAAYRSGRGKCDVDDINPTLCSHLIYTFAGLNADGSIVHMDSWLDLPQGKDAMRRFNNLRDHGNPRLKTLVSIGGANNSCCCCPTWRLRGNGLLLTTSVGINRPYNVASVARNVDYVLLMTYDYNGSWDAYTGHNAPLFAGQGDRTDYQRNLNIEHSVNCWVQGGAPKSKLIVGLAAYGRTFALSSAGNSGPRAPSTGPGQQGDYTATPGTLAYYEVKQIPNLSRRWDAEQCVPYGTYQGNQWVSYDDEESIRRKCEYIRSSGLGGAMMWSIEQDEFQGGRFTLLSTVNRYL
uniref:GH18 domain-containing protein n=1 Tax=Anopheles dirus TaxID=7168 RepID=A0A182NTI3_9DIPT